jgi:hypothetical protein
LAEPYRRLFSLLISDWRKRWSANGGSTADFPFYFVQLANNGTPNGDHRESSWAVLRESQSTVFDSAANTGMAVIIDVGSDVTIHPTNKQDVGKRLALWARAKTYGAEGFDLPVAALPIPCNPRWKNPNQIKHGRITARESQKIRAGPIEETPDAKLEWFEIAGAGWKIRLGGCCPRWRHSVLILTGSAESHGGALWMGK